MRNLSQILPSFRLDPDLYSLLPASDSIVYGEERSMDGSSRDSGRSMYNSTENLLPTPPPASSMNGGSGRSSSYYPQLPQQSQYRQQDQQQSYQQQEYHQRRGSQERYRSPSSDRREYHGASPSSRYQDRPRERR